MVYSQRGMNYNTSEQHKEASKSRQEREHNDSLVLESCIEERNPFDRNVDQLEILKLRYGSGKRCKC